MTSKADFILLGTLRLGRNLARPVDERIGISFSYRPTKSVSFTPSYQHIERQPSAGRDFFEDRTILRKDPQWLSHSRWRDLVSL
jgi:hypothetical protein